ncbi:hypothetical protein A2U01_0088556, partial [Trifolium medium]|nr:hypothetical protein [Trifolium medium]
MMEMEKSEYDGDGDGEDFYGFLFEEPGEILYPMKEE